MNNLLTDASNSFLLLIGTVASEHIGLPGQLKIIERIIKLDEKDAQAFRDLYNNDKTRRGIEEVYTIVGVAGGMGDRKP